MEFTDASELVSKSKKNTKKSFDFQANSIFSEKHSNF